MACKILIIDNDEMMRIFLRDVFWVHGGSAKEYEVDTVKSIAEAAAYLAEHAKSCPDVIFLDVAVSNTGTHSKAAQVEGALDFIRTVKSEGPCKKKTSIIIFSSYDDPTLREKAKEAGAAHFLVKGEQMPKEIIEFVNEHYPARPS